MASGLQHTHVGGNWKVNWVQFVDFHPEHTDKVVLNMGRGGSGVFSGVPGGVLSRPGLTHDVLQLDTGTMVATHTLSDRSVETYSTDGGTTSDGYRRLYLTSVTDSNGKTVSLNWQSIAAGRRLTSLTDASGKITTFSYADSADPLRLTGVTDPFGRSNGMAYAATGRLQQVTDSAGNFSSMTYNIRDEITSVVTPLGTSTFARGTLLNAGGAAQWILDRGDGCEREDGPHRAGEHGRRWRAACERTGAARLRGDKPRWPEHLLLGQAGGPGGADAGECKNRGLG